MIQFLAFPQFQHFSNVPGEFSPHPPQTHSGPGSTSAGGGITGTSAGRPGSLRRSSPTPRRKNSACPHRLQA